MIHECFGFWPQQTITTSGLAIQFLFQKMGGSNISKRPLILIRGVSQIILTVMKQEQVCPIKDCILEVSNIKDIFRVLSFCEG